MIIVLGESVVQVVDAASDAQYGVGLLATGIASFVLLAGMFGLSVVFGYAGLARRPYPHPRRPWPAASSGRLLPGSSMTCRGRHA